MIRILIGDALEQLRTLPDESVHCCVTSPPYFGLRDYGIDGQLGLEPTPDEYITKLVVVFNEVRRVLRDDGTLWLNLGDSYAGSGKGGNPEDSPWKGFVGNTAREAAATVPAGKSRLYGAKPKDLLMMPARVALALQADGWWLRSEIIWHKPNPMPESITDRPTTAHEKLYLLAKSERYWYDADAIAEPSVDPESLNGRNPRNDDKFAQHDPDGFARTRMGFAKIVPGTIYETRNARNVWTITTKPYSDAHFATFPPELPERCIKAGCPTGGTVLDPFFGAGTTGLVADRLGRDCIGIELNPAYAEMARQRIYNDAPLFTEVA